MKNVRQSHNEVVSIEEKGDKDMLEGASKSIASLRKTLSLIERNRIVFIGQYSESRKKEALNYLERTIKEREV